MAQDEVRSIVKSFSPIWSLLQGIATEGSCSPVAVYQIAMPDT